MPRAVAFLLLAMQYDGTAAEPPATSAVDGGATTVVDNAATDRGQGPTQCEDPCPLRCPEGRQACVDVCYEANRKLAGSKYRGRILPDPKMFLPVCHHLCQILPTVRGHVSGAYESSVAAPLPVPLPVPTPDENPTKLRVQNTQCGYPGKAPCYTLCYSVFNKADLPAYCKELCRNLDDLQLRQLAAAPGKKISPDANPTKVRVQDADDSTLADSTPAHENKNNDVNMVLAVAVAMLSVAVLLHAIAATVSRCRGSAPKSNVAARDVVAQESEMEPEAGSPAVLKKDCDSL